MTKLKQNQILRQNQNLLISLAMQQGFEMLQMPTLELEEWVSLEIEKNPSLEIHTTKHSSSSQTALYLEKIAAQPPSLYEHLENQARCEFENAYERSLALKLIYALDENGFLEASLQSIVKEEEIEDLERILSIVQTFDPVGIACKNTQESLLVQLRFLKKQTSFAYQILSHHYLDLLNGSYTEICASLQICRSKLLEIIRTEIAPLSPKPGARFTSHKAHALFPDLQLTYFEERWHVEVTTSYPDVYLAPVYKHCLLDKTLPFREKRSLHKHYTQGKWLLQMLQMRKETLEKIGLYLTKNNSSFLLGDSQTPLPLSIKEMAKALGIHPSTASRAIKNKYLTCPFGIFPLKMFFSHSLTCVNGQTVASYTVKELLKQLIDQEDKKAPFSDAKLAEKLQKKGIHCARRTVSKYRKHLKIASASQRNG